MLFLGKLKFVNVTLSRGTKLYSNFHISESGLCGRDMEMVLDFGILGENFCTQIGKPRQKE
jgi:hypothetical protein